MESMNRREEINFPEDVDWTIVRHALCSLNDKPRQHSMYIFLTGATATERKYSRVNNGDDKCFCGKIDTVMHRVLECPGTDAWREEHPFLRSLEDSKVTLPLCPCIADGKFFQQACSVRPNPVVTQLGDETMYWVYTDGSVHNPTCHLTADAAWAIVYTKALADEALASMTSEARSRQVPVDCFRTLGTGKLIGRQTINRAEMEAAIQAVASIRNAIIFTDSQYVMQIWKRVQDDFRPCEWVNAANGDLTIRLWKAMCSFPGVRSIKFQKIGSHAERKENIWEWSDTPFFHYWGNRSVDHAASEAIKFDHPEVLRRRDNAGRLVRVKKLFYVAVYGAYAKLQKCYEDSRERRPVQSRQQPLQIQEVGDVPPTHFKVVPLHAAETLRWCSHWTHTFMQALYTWIGSLAWPSSSVNTGYVAWAELLASFKHFSGLNVPVKHPTVPHCFTLTQIHPLVQDLTALNAEITRFQSAIKALQQVLKQTVVPKDSSVQCASRLGYYFEGQLGTIHGRPWMPCFSQSRESLSKYFEKLEGTTLHQPLQIRTDRVVMTSPYDAILNTKTHFTGFMQLVKKGKPPVLFSPFAGT